MKPHAATVQAPPPQVETQAPGAPVLALLAHPDLAHSRVHRALRARLRAAAGPALAVRDLYALYPDYQIDVTAERVALASAQLVAWLHPMHWYGMPPLLKLWMDEVLGYGWAYGPGGRALAGKDLWLVVSTGGTEASYRPDGHNRNFIDAFWPPYEQSAALVGMRFLPPTVLHGAHRASLQEIDDHAEMVVQRLRQWPDWPEIADLPPCPECVTPKADRPAIAEPTGAAR
jgi:glutathione-regulated potassium-efflux system ancillary protein KefF